MSDRLKTDVKPPELKGNAWFVPYHFYSISTIYSEKAVRYFTEDLERAVRDFDVEIVIVEDYYRNLIWGEYGTPWSDDTFRAFIKVTHDYGAKILPYTDATELSTTGGIYRKFGREWGAKTSWGKIYCGYSSILYPSVYFLKEYEWYGQIMCPASGWKDYFLNQITRLHENFEIDGIYLDRVDYRVKCYDHLTDPDHFSQNIPVLVRELRNINKSFGSDNILIINDSCMKPDEITVKVFENADGILSELLLADMNPYGIENRLSVLFGNIAWKFRLILRPALTYILPKLYQTRIMTDDSRIREIITRLKKAAPSKHIYLFSHRTDTESRRFLSRYCKNNDIHLCFFTGHTRMSKIIL